VPRGTAPEEFRTFLRGQIAELTTRAKEAGLEPG
ncbi:MAG: Tripartite-type tricarboxylate transporter, receptor component TctC, partial [Belnapia sp.]|nr:Tripartite-type tricarboxylate transporter, receptor component TctC [Belnapia sp.]